MGRSGLAPPKAFVQNGFSVNKWSTALGTFAYDAANQLTDTTDRIGQRVTYAYDGDGRETGETWYREEKADVDCARKSLEEEDVMF